MTHEHDGVPTVATQDGAPLLDARKVKRGDRLLIRYVDRDEVVVVDDVTDNGDEGVSFTVTPAR